jgi:DNA-directed RNA polymerase subunit beta'
LQQDFTHGKLHVPAGTLLTPDVVGKIRATSKNARIVVRSPMKCEEEAGICQKCAGLSSSGHHHELGTNVGVHAAHAIGERSVQLTLKKFHTGGATGSAGVDPFERFSQLMTLPKTIPNEASLAMVGGKIDKILPTATGVDIIIGNHKHHVGRDVSGNPLNQSLVHAPTVGWTPPRVGLHVEAGASLSDPGRTFMNPHRLYAATGSMEKVQNHLVNDVYALYEPLGIKRRAVETVARAMGNLTEVLDAGDHHGVLRGEYRPLSSIHRMNAELLQQGMQPIEHKPVLKGVNVMPLEVHEDWMAKLQHEKLRETLTDAAATAGVSHYHGMHPIPGIAFGAEFGLTDRDALLPGREHLKNVPKHHY